MGPRRIGSTGSGVGGAEWCRVVQGGAPWCAVWAGCRLKEVKIITPQLS